MSKGANREKSSANVSKGSLRWRPLALLAGLLVVAAGIRLLALHQASQSPFYDTPISDSAAYVELAREGGGEDSFFYSAPFYAGFLRWTLLKPGMLWWMPRFVQGLLGVALSALVFAIGRSLFGVWEGLAGAFLCALYAPLIFYETHLLPATWTVFLTAGGLAALLAGVSKDRALCWVAAGGFLLGWAVIGNHTLLLFPPAALLWWIWMRSGSLKNAVKGRVGRACLWECPLLVLGFLLPLGWSAARNTRLADQFMVFPVSVGVFFRAGNNEIAFQELSGIFSLPPEERQAAEGYKWSKLYAQMKSGEEEMTPREVSSFWWGQGWLPWKKDPRRGVLLFWKKALLAFTANEIPIVQDMEFEKRFMSLFRWPLPSMGWLLPLTSAGLVWRVRERKHLLPLLLAVSQCAMLGLFFVNSRQRLPLVVGLLPLAGAAIATVPDWIRKSRWNVLTAGAVAAVGGLLLTTAFEPPDAAERLDFMANRSAAACLEKGDYEGAVELFREVLDSQEEPNPMTLNNAAYVMAERYDKTGEGDLSEAISLARQALKETKGSPMAADTLIWLLLLDFQTDEAGRMLGAFMHRFPSYRQFYLRWAYMQMLSCNFEAAKNTIRDLVSKGSPELREQGRLLLEEVVERERLMNESPTDESPTGGDE